MPADRARKQDVWPPKWWGWLFAVPGFFRFYGWQAMWRFRISAVWCVLRDHHCALTEPEGYSDAGYECGKCDLWWRAEPENRRAKP